MEEKKMSYEYDVALSFAGEDRKFVEDCAEILRSLNIGLSYQISVELAETLTTVFSLVFTILFGFAAVIVEKSVNDNPKKERVVSETFVSIVTSTVLSLFAAVISILLTTIKTILIISILSFALLDLSFTIMMLLLMITKRTFVIYCESD